MMTSESMTGHWPLFKLMILLSFGRSLAELCDRVSTAQEREGNLGQSEDFSWLGVLHVHLDVDWIATTGIVLIKTKYALAIAEDVAKIPPNIFKSYSKAMFFKARDTPWFVKLASYITYPEYELSNLNTIAVIELDLDEDDDFPLTPICFADAKISSASRYLYLTGFTDKNHILEKVIYNIQYLDKKVCDGHYNKTELSSLHPIPSAHLCGYSPNSATQCVWDNGMTLVSNSFGYLNLVGFSVHGPGCASPARFIDLFPYYDWINSVTDESRYRRNGFFSNNRRKAFVPHKKRKEVVPNIPIHELYTMGGARRKEGHGFEAYPPQIADMKFHLIEPSKDGNAYMIFPFKDQWEKSEGSCTIPTFVIYEELFKVTALDNLGSATYKLSLYDTMNSDCICVRLTVNCDKRSDAILAFKEEINFKEDTYQEGIDRTPEDLFKYFPKPKEGSKEPFLKPSIITDDNLFTKHVLTYDLYITFNFTERAELKFEMLGEKPIPTIPSISTSTTATESENRTDTTETSNSPSGKVDMKNNMLRVAKVRVIDVADVEEPSGTQSAARGEGTALMAGCLIGACVLRALFIN